MTQWTRREFLKGAGIGSLVLMALEAGLLSASDLDEIAESIARGEESWISTVCQMCPGACGIRVRRLGSWPVSLAGNPLHPVNRGALCPKGVASLLSFYDPDRIRSPLKRVGNRGEGKWEKISWEEAIATLGQELQNRRSAGESHKVGFMGGRFRGLMRTLLERFCEAYGTPNFIDNSFAIWQGPFEALQKTHGVRAEPTFDLERSQYALSFCAPILEASSSPVENLRGWANLRRGPTRRRGKVVQLESRLSVTAAKADEWIPIRAGSEGLVALGIAETLLKEELYDGFYLGDHTQGFQEFKGFILENYSAETIADLTGVPVDTLIRLAREFAAAKPAVAISGRLDARDQVAIYTLNALVGSINVPGGVHVPRMARYGDLPPVVRDEVAATGLSQPPSDLLSGGPYPLSLLFFFYTNPLFSNPTLERFREVLSKVPLLVSFSPFMDETTALCDLVLPDHHFLERHQDIPGSTVQGFPFVGIAQPVRSPLFETRPTGEVILEIARGLGGAVATSFPWKTFEELLKTGLKNLYESRSGDLFGTAFESDWTALLARAGWSVPSYGSFEDFEVKVREKGGWWEPIDSYEEWGRVFANETGRFEFPTLKDLPLAAAGRSADFPLFLNVFPLMALTGGRNAGQAWLADIAGPHIQLGWTTWLEVHPETAHHLGIRDRDEVWVESASGRFVAVAKLYEGIHPDVVAAPFGLGHTEMGRWAKGIGANPRQIQESERQMTRVKVYKA